MDLKIIGKVNFRNILYFGVLEVLATVLICYTLAVMEGHKPAWLPTISECGVEPPEKYIFRWGIMTGGILLFIEAIILYWSKWTSSLEYYLGMIAGLLLTGVAVVAVNENLTVHLSKENDGGVGPPVFLLEGGWGGGGKAVWIGGKS